MKLKRLISITLIFSLILTLIPAYPKYVYADYLIGGSAGSGHFTSDGKANWNRNYQGIRVSIVDKNGNNVLKYQGMGYNGIDILFDNPYTRELINDKDMCNKFDQSPGNYEQMQWSTVKNMMKAAADSHPMERVRQLGAELGRPGYTIPLPIISSGGDYIANGLATKKFFVSGELASNITIGSQSITPINAGELVISSASGGYVKTSSSLFI